MNSFVQANEQTVIDYHSIHPKMRQAPKSFAFFIYYQRTPQQSNSTYLQKLAFTLKQQKIYNSEKHQPGKNVQLHFVDLQNQQQVDQSFFDLKMQLLQSPKTKLIFYSQQNHLIHILIKAQQLSIDLTHVPSALYSPDLHGDLSQHLGWRQPHLGDLSLKTSTDFEINVRKWITSPGQRIDMWTVHISVDSEEGHILKLNTNNNTFQPVHEKTLQENFLSHLSIGHHAQLAANYESHRKEHNHSVINQLIFNIESIKKFCCIGSPSLQASTGIVSIIFQDDKGITRQITKQLVQQGSKRGILTLLFSNIDKYMGMKLNGGRLNDGRLEMGVYQSSNQFRLVGSSSGEILIRLKAAEIFMSVNNTCFKLVQPRELKLSLWGKTRMLISKDTLQC